MNGAEVFENKYINKIETLLSHHSDKPSLRGYYYFLNNLSKSSIYSYLCAVSNFLDHIQKQPEQLTLDDYTTYLSHISGKVNSYQIMVYSALKKFSQYLKAAKINMDHSMEIVPRPKAKESIETKEKRSKGYLEKKEIKKMLSAIENGAGSKRAVSYQDSWRDRDRLIICIFLTTGMRCSALYKLDVNSIDFETGTLVTVDKGDQIKTYELGEEVLDYAKKWLVNRKRKLGGNQENALFISNQKNRMCQGAIAKVVKKYSHKIAGKNITPHKLRATYGTQLYEATHDIYFVQDSMGHASPQTTELYIRGQKSTNMRKAQTIASSLLK